MWIRWIRIRIRIRNTACNQRQLFQNFTANQQKPVLGIRIRMFLGLPDPDPLVRGANPDPTPDPSFFS